MINHGSSSRDLGADHIPLVGSPTTIGESPMSPESRGREAEVGIAGAVVEVPSVKLSSASPHIITPNGQIIEAISIWAKIEMVEGMTLVPEVIK